MGMRVRGVFGSEKGASWTARRWVGRTGEERLRTASSCVFVRGYALEGAVFATFSAWHRVLHVMSREDDSKQVSMRMRWEDRSRA